MFLAFAKTLFKLNIKLVEVPVDFKQKNSQRNNFNIVAPNTVCVSQIVLNIPNDLFVFGHRSKLSL